MAEMSKKLHFLKNGTEQTAKAYSTTSESGSSYITNVIDNITCYVPLVSTSDSRATYGRVLKSGTTYAIASSGKPAYTEKSWTTAGTYTWTAPVGVTRVRVAVCGGGCSGLALTLVRITAGTYYGSVGGASSFGNLMKTTPPSHGASIVCKVYHYGNEESDYYVDLRERTSPCGSPNGRNGITKGSSHMPGGTGYALSFTLANGSYGKGGNAREEYPIDSVSGGSGGYNTGYVNVTPGSTYTITVGAGEGKPTSNNVAAEYFDVGNSGFVLIAYGGSI